MKENIPFFFFVFLFIVFLLLLSGDQIIKSIKKPRRMQRMPQMKKHRDSVMRQVVSNDNIILAERLPQNSNSRVP